MQPEKSNTNRPSTYSFWLTNVVISMNKFIETKATKKSISARRPVYGVGINDSEYKIMHEGSLCPFYKKWNNMLERCYSSRYPTYQCCNVIDEWLFFSNFKKWMAEQDWEGKELDKDVLLIGNKIYGPDTCLFVSKHVNVILIDSDYSCRKYPKGVQFDKSRNKFKACCHVNGKRKTIGRYNSQREAANAYNVAKHNEIIRIANLQTDDRVRNGLLRHAQLRLNS